MIDIISYDFMDAAICISDPNALSANYLFVSCPPPPSKLVDDRMALVSGISLDPEAAIGVTKKLPPKWIEGVDEVI